MPQTPLRAIEDLHLHQLVMASLLWLNKCDKEDPNRRWVALAIKAGCEAMRIHVPGPVSEVIDATACKNG